MLLSLPVKGTLSLLGLFFGLSTQIVFGGIAHEIKVLH